MNEQVGDVIINISTQYFGLEISDHTFTHCDLLMHHQALDIF